MKKIWTAAALSVTFAALPQLSAKAVVLNFTSNLSGAQEVPPTNTPATGTATSTLTGDPGSYVFNYTVNYSNLTSGVQMGHVHSPAPPGANAPVVHPLDNLVLGTTSGTINGDWRFDDPINPLTDTRAQQLINGLGYFNLHTTNFPSGEIRGQITAVPEPSATLGLLLLGAAGVTARFQNQKTKKKVAIK